MHDPMTVAFEIPSPFRDPPSKLWPDGYRPDIVTIWHEDPEADGSDDSCGWAYPRLTKEQIEKLHNAAWGESHYPYFLRQFGREWKGSRVEAEAMYRALLLHVADLLDIRLSFDEAARIAAKNVHRDGAGGLDTAAMFCFEPGYHTNHKEDSPRDRQEYWHGELMGIARQLLRMRRPWWRHPRWHVWHWSIQIHPLQAFKRWMWSRCCKCGGSFAWRETPIGYSWHSDGPGWFRGEKGIAHARCDAEARPAQEVTP